MKTKHSLYRNQPWRSNFPFKLSIIHLSLPWNMTLWFFTCYCYFLFQFLDLILPRLREQQTNMPNQYANTSKLCCQISIKSELGLNLRKFTAGIGEFTLGKEWKQLTLERSEQQSVNLKAEEKKDLLTILLKVSCAYFHLVSACELQSLFVVV